MLQAHAFIKDFRFSPLLCNYFCSLSMWDLQFSYASNLEASMRKGLCSRFRLGEVEPSFKEFLAFPSRMHLALVSIKNFLASPAMI
jgi:hypothetical protein